MKGFDHAKCILGVFVKNISMKYIHTPGMKNLLTFFLFFSFLLYICVCVRVCVLRFLSCWVFVHAGFFSFKHGEAVWSLRKSIGRILPWGCLKQTSRPNLPFAVHTSCPLSANGPHSRGGGRGFLTKEKTYCLSNLILW